MGIEHFVPCPLCAKRHSRRTTGNRALITSVFRGLDLVWREI